jgi:hypothetical protein
MATNQRRKAGVCTTMYCYMIKSHIIITEVYFTVHMYHVMDFQQRYKQKYLTKFAIFCASINESILIANANEIIELLRQVLLGLP